jgi:hypothetical protein
VFKNLCKAGIRVTALTVLCFGLCWGQGRAPATGRTKGSPGGRGATNPTDPNAPKGVYPTSRGILKSISGSLLFVELDDEHEMKFRITRKTKFLSQNKQDTQEIKASSLHPGQTVSVDMQSTLDGSFEAVRIILESPNP